MKHCVCRLACFFAFNSSFLCHGFHTFSPYPMTHNGLSRSATTGSQMIPDSVNSRADSSQPASMVGLDRRQRKSSLSLAAVGGMGGTTSFLATLTTKLAPLSKNICVIGGMAILAGYHYRLRLHETKGIATWRSRQALTRKEWSKFVGNTEGWLYAVQTLRNAITANTFLATTVLSLLTVISGRLWAIQAAQTVGNYSKLKFSSIGLCMLLSAYEFLQSARLMTHAGFMFPVVKNNAIVGDIMSKASSAQWLGLRWLYISIAGIVWTTAGEKPFLVASLALTFFFQFIDRVPGDNL